MAAVRPWYARLLLLPFVAVLVEDIIVSYPWLVRTTILFMYAHPCTYSRLDLSRNTYYTRTRQITGFFVLFSPADAEMTHIIYSRSQGVNQAGCTSISLVVVAVGRDVCSPLLVDAVVEGLWHDDPAAACCLRSSDRTATFLLPVDQVGWVEEKSEVRRWGGWGIDEPSRTKWRFFRMHIFA